MKHRGQQSGQLGQSMVINQYKGSLSSTIDFDTASGIGTDVSYFDTIDMNTDMSHIDMAAIEKERLCFKCKKCNKRTQHEEKGIEGINYITICYACGFVDYCD